MSTLADRVLDGDTRALARALSLVENDPRAAAGLVRALFSSSGSALVVGLTGPPGAGKSTLADRLASAYRRDDRRVGVLAVDPSSPFTGGALLGDRIRLQAHAGDPDVFIRSMATRGHLGGLARATADAALVLDAAGYDVILIETVGVGQDEVDVVRTADVAVVALVPGGGDDVQALKAGIMEIADVFVVNKADLDGADRLVAAIEAVLALGDVAADGWRPPVIETEATTGRGVDDVVSAIATFAAQASDDRDRRRRDRAEARLRDILDDRCQAAVARVVPRDAMARLVDEVVSRRTDPYTVADRVMARVLPETKEQ